MNQITIPDIGKINNPGAFTRLTSFTWNNGAVFRPGVNGVRSILQNRGEDCIIIIQKDAFGRQFSNIIPTSKTPGIPLPMFPLCLPAKVCLPLKGVLLDLDGTCVKSEPLWIAVILATTNSIRTQLGLAHLDDFSSQDIPHVSGRTVPDHLNYCLERYCPGGSYEKARLIYDDITQNDSANQMPLILEKLRRQGKSPHEAVNGTKELFSIFEEQAIPWHLVTSGLRYKAEPEAIEFFNQMGMSHLFNPDKLISAGNRGRNMGDAISKPWPNPYIEAAKLYGFDGDSQNWLIVGDSAADVISGVTGGITVIGVKGGNIERSGVDQLCFRMLPDLMGLTSLIKDLTDQKALFR